MVQIEPTNLEPVKTKGVSPHETLQDLMTEARPKPTLKDIARLSEASPSTVSAVLTGTWRLRRISEPLAERIRAIAHAEGYSANRQARGLRRGRSDMVGLILPMHDNRFFAATAQSFEAEARQRNLCPVVVSTLRDPAEERRTVERLISHAVDSLVIAGASDPAAVGAACRAAGVPHVYVDLPGRDAPSVVSDNREGARRLAQTLVERMPRGGCGPRALPYFVGGLAGDHATAGRIRGFREALAAAGMPAGDGQVIARGYAPSRSAAELAALSGRLGGLPAALFINSLTVFEGAMTHFATLAPPDFAHTAIGCYDYDPIASFLPFPVHMVRQDSERLVARAFDLIDQGARGHRVIEVPPLQVAPRTLVAAPFPDLG